MSNDSGSQNVETLNTAIEAIRQNDFRGALNWLERIPGSHPKREQARLLNAQCRHALGEYAESERLFLSLVREYPDNAFYRHSLAILYNDWQRPEQALEHAQAAAAIAPGSAECWIQLSLAQRSLGDGAGALQSAEKAVALSGGSPDALKHRGYANLMLHRPDAASRDFTGRMRAVFGPGTTDWRPEFVRTTPAKLRHDIEQYRYLCAQAPDSALAFLADQHRHFLAQLPDDLPHDRIITLPPLAINDLGAGYNRLHRFSEAERLEGGAVNGALDFRAIEDDYRRRSPGITWIDGFLRHETLASLRRYCLENTFWFDFHHPDGYLGALMENGFAAPLLFQIAEDLQRHLPGIFRDYPLFQMWAFKYDSRLRGIQTHADVAAVNLNFWLTPDEANLDPDSGGLVIWDKEAPADWRFGDFNSGDGGRQQRIRDFLHDSGAQRVVVPYRQNRAVLFNSDLFHRTDDIRFKEGYENRRINITLLFGQR